MQDADGLTKSDVWLSGNREAAAITKRLGRDLQSRRRLLSLVLAPLHHSDHIAHKPEIEAMIARDLLGAVRFLNIVLENRIQNLVRRQHITVFLAGTQLG